MDYLNSISASPNLTGFSRNHRRGAGDGYEQNALNTRESSNGRDNRSFAGILDRMLAR